MTPTQGEHAQTEALRPKFGDLLRNTMASESNPRRDAYFIREVHRSGGGVNPGRWFEMTDGKGETWLCNPQNMVSAATAQPAAPQGVAYAELPEPDGEHHEDAAAGVGRLYSCGHYTAARLLEFGDQQFNAGREFEHERAADLRASHGQAPAGATITPEQIKEILGTPEKVHLNMLHGHLATITMEQCAHLHGEEMQRKWAAAQQAPAAGNWQQYAKDGETAQQCIERHRSEHDALLTLLADARAKAPAAGAVAGLADVAALRAKAVQACANANGRDWEFMYSGHQDEQVGAWLDGYSAGQAATPTPAAQADSQPSLTPETASAMVDGMDMNDAARKEGGA